MPTADTVAALTGPMPRRRVPRTPTLARVLLIVWWLVLAACMVILGWSLWATGQAGQPGLKLTVMVVAMLNWLLLVWRTKRLQRLDRKVKGANGAVCLNCHYELAGGEGTGVCPECGEPYDMAVVRELWRRHTP